MRNAVRLGQGAVAAIVLVGCVLAVPASSEAACTSYTSPEATFTDGNCVVGSGKIVLRGGTYRHHFNGETLHDAEVAQLTASNGTKTIEKAGYLLTPNFEGELLGSASVDAAGRFHAQELRYGTEDLGMEGKLYDAQLSIERQNVSPVIHRITKHGYLLGPAFEGELNLEQELHETGHFVYAEELRHGVEDLGIEGMLYDVASKLERGPYGYRLTKQGYLLGSSFEGQVFLQESEERGGPGTPWFQRWEDRYGTEDLGAEGKLYDAMIELRQGPVGSFTRDNTWKHGYLVGPQFEGEVTVYREFNEEGQLIRFLETRYGTEDLGAEGKLYNTERVITRQNVSPISHQVTKRGHLVGPTFEGELSVNMEINEEGAIRYGEHVLDGAWHIDNHEFIGQLRVINNEGVVEVIDTRTSDPGEQTGPPPPPPPGSGGF